MYFVNDKIFDHWSIDCTKQRC